ncbi:MAG: hypothetical protein LBG82_01055 [Clostridiales Family XIII bacterium]|nr:hypothetical protein [Clostridiales Family XIII bacterium]
MDSGSITIELEIAFVYNRRMASKKNGQSNIGQVIIPAGHPNPPEAHEVEAAQILAAHYGCAIEFLLPVDDYMRNTPDLTIQGIEWELKSPVGKSKNTIRRQLWRGAKQSKNIIIDARRTPLKDDRIENVLRFEMEKRTSIKRLIFISKTSQVLELKK